MLDEKYKKAANIIIKAGILPFPLNDTLIKILKHIITEEKDLDFIIKAFKRKFSLTMEQLKKNTKMTEKEILPRLNSLASKGVIFDQPSSSGLRVYRLLPLMMVGPFEYIYMGKINYTDEEKELAILFKELFDDAKVFIQNNYAQVFPIFENLPPIDRTVPILQQGVSGKEIQIDINENIEVPKELIVLSQTIEDMIEKFDEIAVGHCFCRHHRDLLNQPCKQTKLRENCFVFGKSARYTVEKGFTRFVSKVEALDIMKKSEEDGLVHKAFHPHSDITKAETSICNCCRCCCETFELWRDGALPLINSTNYLSQVNEDICNGCETCVEKCPIDAISMNKNDKAEVNDKICLGCGVCAHFCPEGAISLLEGMRNIFAQSPLYKQ